MSNNSLTNLHQLVWIALMAAAIAAGAYLVVPIGPVPISMQPFFIFLAGFILGGRRGALAVALYILAGVIGLPVFAGGKSGLGHLLGPTGGYLIGFVVAAGICGLAQHHEKTIPWGKGLAFGAGGLLSAYFIGALWLKFALDLDWAKTWLVGVVPFIPFDGIKLVLALVCVRYLTKSNLLPGQR